MTFTNEELEEILIKMYKSGDFKGSSTKSIAKQMKTDLLFKDDEKWKGLTEKKVKDILDTFSSLQQVKKIPQKTIRKYFWLLNHNRAGNKKRNFFRKQNPQLAGGFKSH